MLSMKYHQYDDALKWAEKQLELERICVGTETSGDAGIDLDTMGTTAQSLIAQIKRKAVQEAAEHQEWLERGA